jgi:hypothetical protein
LIPRLQLLLEALEQGYTGEPQRIEAFTDQLSLRIVSSAVEYLKHSLSSNDGPDKLASEDYPKMIANLLEKRGSKLMRDETLAKVSRSHVLSTRCDKLVTRLF